MGNFLQSLKNQVIRALTLASVGVRPNFFPGTDFFGRNIYALSRFRFRPSYSENKFTVGLGGWGLVDRLSDLSGELLLDVGAGSLGHSHYFASKGKQVTAIDFGTSTYALNRQAIHDEFGKIEVIQTDFNEFVSEKQWDIVWASHILEHQKNAGEFLANCLQHTKESGLLVLVLPFPHEEIWGGHLSYWTPGLLAYNLVMAGTSMADSSAFESHGEFVLVVKKKSIDLKGLGLSFDSGDVQKLSDYLPSSIQEGSTSFVFWDSLRLKI
jgi:SAM-dependent methyltransferase